MFAIDLFLIVAIVIGTRLDSKDLRSRPVQPSKTVEQKQYEEVQVDKDQLEDLKEPDGKVEAESKAVAKPPRKAPKFCEAFMLYHRLLNICASSYHVVQRPARAFSLAL